MERGKGFNRSGEPGLTRCCRELNFLSPGQGGCKMTVVSSQWFSEEKIKICPKKISPRQGKKKIQMSGQVFKGHIIRVFEGGNSATNYDYLIFSKTRSCPANAEIFIFLSCLNKKTILP